MWKLLFPGDKHRITILTIWLSAIRTTKICAATITIATFVSEPFWAILSRSYVFGHQCCFWLVWAIFLEPISMHLISFLPQPPMKPASSNRSPQPFSIRSRFEPFRAISWLLKAILRWFELFGQSNFGLKSFHQFSAKTTGGGGGRGGGGRHHQQDLMIFPHGDSRLCFYTSMRRL